MANEKKTSCKIENIKPYTLIDKMSCLCIVIDPMPPKGFGTQMLLLT